MRRIGSAFRHPLVILAIILLFLPYLLGLVGSTVSLATEILIFVIVGLGFNILLGYTGLVSFGHGAYFGLAAYAAALTQLHFQKGMAIPIVVGVLSGAILGAIVGFLIMRKKGVYFALLTLAFTQMFFYVVYRATSVTGGENGLGGIERLPVGILGFFVLDLRSPLNYYYVVYCFFVVSVYLMWRIVHSPFGAVLQAIRDNDERARCVGYDTKRYRYVAFIISCTFVGLAGALYVFLLCFAYPEAVGWVMGGDIVAMTVVGGMRSFLGPVVGGAFFILLRDFLTSYTENWLIFFGGLFMLFILFSPQGITGVIQRVFPATERFLGLRYRGRAMAVAAPVGGGTNVWSLPQVKRRQAANGGGNSDGEQLLVCKGLVKRFGAFAAVDGVDIVVRRGGIHSIIGPNGAGKTTLFNCLTGLVSPTGGRIVFKGEDITRLPVHETVSRGIARSFQITSIFGELSVFENIRVAVQAASRHRFDLLGETERLREVNEDTNNIIKQVGLSGKEVALAANLSHGDQRLLEIGIALATRPKLLLLDEPLAGLSSAETVRIGDFVRGLAKEVTILLIEHKIDSVLALSNKITVMHQGRVIGEGAPEQVAGDQGVQQAYLGEVGVASLVRRRTSIQPRERTMLRVENINTYYGKSHILHNVSFRVDEGEVVCLLGRNGAGKTTTLRSVMGITPPRSGFVYFRGENIAGQAAEEVARLGIGLIPQGRRIFPNLTVSENLLLASRKGSTGKWTLESVFSRFPRLAERKNSKGETLSGGERQMLAVARALMGNVDLLLLDEPFEGLAPTVVAEVAEIIQEIRSHTTVLLVEQSASLALAISDRAYVLSDGQIAYEGEANELEADEGVKKRLLGI